MPRKHASTTEDAVDEPTPTNETDRAPSAEQGQEPSAGETRGDEAAGGSHAADSTTPAVGLDREHVFDRRRLVGEVRALADRAGFGLPGDFFPEVRLAAVIAAIEVDPNRKLVRAGGSRR